MPGQIRLRRLSGTPVGGYGRKFSHDQRFDVRRGGLLIIEVGSHVSDVRIGQTDNLPRVARVRKNFLISREAGIENNFAAATCAGSRGASLKNSSIFECKCPLPFDSFCQRSLSLARAAGTARTICLQASVKPALFF